MTGSTFLGNSSPDGGGIVTRRTGSITSSTIAGNIGDGIQINGGSFHTIGTPDAATPSPGSTVRRVAGFGRQRDPRQRHPFQWRPGHRPRRRRPHRQLSASVRTSSVLRHLGLHHRRHDPRRGYAQQHAHNDLHHRCYAHSVASSPSSPARAVSTRGTSRPRPMSLATRASTSSSRATAPDEIINTTATDPTKHLELSVLELQPGDADALRLFTSEGVLRPTSAWSDRSADRQRARSLRAAPTPPRARLARVTHLHARQLESRRSRPSLVWTTRSPMDPSATRTTTAPR